MVQSLPRTSQAACGEQLHFRSKAKIGKENGSCTGGLEAWVMGTTPTRVRPGDSYWQSEGRIGEARKPGPTGDIDDPNATNDVVENDCDDIGSNHGPFSQPEVGLSEIVNGALARSLAQRSFVPATAFGGARPGTVFATGVQGLGYYRGTSGMGSVAGAHVADDGDDRQVRPVVILLVDLLCTETVPRRTRPRRLRVRKRIQGRRVMKAP